MLKDLLAAAEILLGTGIMYGVALLPILVMDHTATQEAQEYKTHKANRPARKITPGGPRFYT